MPAATIPAVTQTGVPAPGSVLEDEAVRSSLTVSPNRSTADWSATVLPTLKVTTEPSGKDSPANLCMVIE